MKNELLLLSGNDIPLYSANLIIHQPTIKEIAHIGEEAFFTGCEFLRFSKDNLEEKDKALLENYTNFEVLMSIVRTEKNNPVIAKNFTCLKMVLALMFPTYQFKVNLKSIDFTMDGVEEVLKLDKDNYQDFINILESMFCLEQTEDQKMNPTGELAKRIADKLKKRHKKLSEKDGGGERKVAIMSRYVSILATAHQKDINDLTNYTVFQLFDEFKRFELKVGYDIYFQAKLAGATDLKEPEDWMQDLHPSIL